jgi:hypothetical protein
MNVAALLWCAYVQGPQRGTLNIETNRLERLDHVAGADAAGADLDALDAAVPHCLDLLQVGVPGAAGLVVGVADVITEAGAFTTDFAYFGHDFIPPIELKHYFVSDCRTMRKKKVWHWLQNS